MKRLPERRLAYLRELRYALWVPVYLICFFLLERLITDGYWATQLPLDRLIPFCPVFVVFYCLWYPLLVACICWRRTGPGSGGTWPSWRPAFS